MQRKFIENENCSIILSTHITSDLEHIADNIVFINDGEIVLQKKRDEIIDLVSGGNTLDVNEMERKI